MQVGGSFQCLLEAVEMRSQKKYALDSFPETLYLTQRNGLVERDWMCLNQTFFHILLEAVQSTPVGVLPAVVGEHPTRHAVFGHRPPVGL